MNKKVVRVLSIEDNPADALLIQEQLARAAQRGWDLPHFEVEHVSHLAAGLSHLGEKEFDVVLSDLDLPDSQAGETVATLREFVPQMPIVVLTGREDNELAQKSVRAGVQDYLYKDEATGSLLARAMMYAIERQQAHENLERCVVERTSELRRANQKLQAEIIERERVEEALLDSRSRVRRKLRSILSPSGDIGPLELSDIIDVRAIQALMDDFYELTNTGVAIVDMKGEVLVSTGWQDICTQFHRVHPVTNQYCIESDTVLSSGVEPGEYKLYKCKNNMWDMATPIIVGGQRVGNLFLGQFFFDDEAVDREMFRKQAQKYGFDEEEYLAALDRVPRWPRERVETVFRFYARFAKMVSKLSHSNLKLARALAEKDRLLAAHKESEQKFKSYIEHAPYGVFVADEEGRYVEVNETASRLTGYDREELLNMHILQLVPPDYHQVAEEHFRTVTEEGFATAESPFVMKDGNVRWWSVSAMRLSEERFLAYAADITERKQAENSLRESEERYRLLFESSPDAIALIGLEGKVLDCNPATSKIAGLPQEEIIGKPFAELDILDAERMSLYMDIFSKTLSGQEVERFELKTKKGNGQIRWVEAFAQPIIKKDEVQAIQVIARDITERRQAEEQLSLQSMLLDQIQDMVTATDLEGRITYVNEAECRTFGRSADELIGRHVEEYGEVPSRGATQQDIITTTLAEGQWRGEVVNITDSNREVVLDCRTQLLNDESGEPIGMVGISTDITKRKKMERRLERKLEEVTALSQASRAMTASLDLDQVLSEIISLASDVLDSDYTSVMLVDEKGEINQTIETPSNMPVLKYRIRDEGFTHWIVRSQQAIIIDEIYDDGTFTPYPDDGAPQSVNSHLLEAGIRSFAGLPLAVKGRLLGVLYLHSTCPTIFHNQETLLDAFANQVAIAIENARLYQAAQQKIAERKRAEEEIARYATELKRSNQELEQFGYIVSHDLQAPLRAVRSYLQLLIKRYRGQIDPKADKYISSAVDGTERMQDMIKALLDLSRVKTRGKEFEPTDCEVVLEHVLDDLAPTIEEGGAAVTYGPLPTVMADKAQLAQVFQNLIANGIKFRREDVPPRVHIAAERVVDDEWMFSVEDNGIGISQEKLELIFQIFQRLHTEEEYPGLGIGLALCKRIVKRHGGRIWVESQAGQGAKFYFTIPVREI